MKKKTINVSFSNWKRLKYLQLEKNYNSLDEIISGLITYYMKGN